MEFQSPSQTNTSLLSTTGPESISPTVGDAGNTSLSAAAPLQPKFDLFTTLYPNLSGAKKRINRELVDLGRGCSAGPIGEDLVRSQLLSPTVDELTNIRIIVRLASNIYGTGKAQLSILNDTYFLRSRIRYIPGGYSSLLFNFLRIILSTHPESTSRRGLSIPTSTRMVAFP